MQIIATVAVILAESMGALIRSEHVLANDSHPRAVRTHLRPSWMTVAIGGIEHPG